jgi:hypothetical protein
MHICCSDGTRSAEERPTAREEAYSHALVGHLYRICIKVEQDYLASVAPDIMLLSLIVSPRRPSNKRDDALDIEEGQTSGRELARK